LLVAALAKNHLGLPQRSALIGHLVAVPFCHSVAQLMVLLMQSKLMAILKAIAILSTN